MKKCLVPKGNYRGLLVYLSALIAVLPLEFAAPPARADSKPGLSGSFYGEAKTVGAGTARSYVSLKDGVPVELGFELSEGTLQALPSGEKWQRGQHHNYKEYLLALPREADVTPIRLLELDWNPGGHEPPGIYDVPHFDFHFYAISRGERDAIDPADPDYMKKAEHLPTQDLVPAGYITPKPIMPIARMGVHWVNQNAEELHGKPFTHTFIHGSWDGRFIFYEPMVAYSFLASNPDVSLSFPVAQCDQPSEYQPSKYNVRYDPATRAYRVALSGFNHCKADASAITADPRESARESFQQDEDERRE